MDEGRGARGGRISTIALLAAVGILGVSIAVRANQDQAAPASGSIAPATAAPEPTSALEQRLRANPADGEGWATLGMSYFGEQRYADAAGAYARAVQLMPARAGLWSALGEAQTLAANAIDSVAHDAFSRAVAIDPKDARARYFLAVEKDVAGDHRGAVDDWIGLLGDAPAGAPWAASVRDLVQQVAQREKIDIDGRLPSVGAAPGLGGRLASAAIPGPTAQEMSAAAQLSPKQQDAMARGMVERLAERLAANPRDADGWIRLMRARMVLGETAAARQALAASQAAFAGDAATLARLAEAAGTLGLPAR